MGKLSTSGEHEYAFVRNHDADLWSFRTLLGATVFQSFIGGVVAYQCLPRPQFATLQQKTFPVFFSLQSILPLIMIATYPGEKMLGARENSGFNGVMAESNRWTVFVPIATILVTSVANLFLVGPATTKTMKERHHQGKAKFASRKCYLVC